MESEVLYKYIFIFTRLYSHFLFHFFSLIYYLFCIFNVLSLFCGYANEMQSFLSYIHARTSTCIVQLIISFQSVHSLWSLLISSFATTSLLAGREAKRMSCSATETLSAISPPAHGRTIRYRYHNRLTEFIMICKLYISEWRNNNSHFYLEYSNYYCMAVA